MSETKIAEATRLESEQQFEQAIALLEDLLQQEPTCVDACVHLAADSGILGRFPQAEQYARRGLTLDPTSGKARYYLACALRDQNKLGEASREMERALLLVKREVAQGTVAGAIGLTPPLYGLARKIEQDAMNLRVRIFMDSLKTGLSNVINRFRPRKKALFSLSISGEKQTYQNEQYGFEIDIPDDWSLHDERVPLLWAILFRVIRGWNPRVDVAFTGGPNETLNIVIEPMSPEPPPNLTERAFMLQAREMGYADYRFSRIIVENREHTCVCYQIAGKVWSKKYMIVLDGHGYAITASCDNQKFFTKREEVWDEIAASLRLVYPS